ncbi:MAG: hypothetical protein ABIO79_15360 [Ferruginibacter sp.]
MKTFLRQTFLFFAIPFGVLMVVLFLLNYINNKAMTGYKIDASVNSLFIGDSHVQCAINPALLPDAVNLSQSSETMLFSYFKIKYILENNPAIKRIYLGFSYHNISTYGDEFTYGKYAYDIASRYFFILPFEQKKEIAKHTLDELPKFLGKLLINGSNTLLAKKENYSFLGAYKNGYKNVVASKPSMDDRLSLQFYENGKQRGFSSVNIGYLNKIMFLCKEKNIELVILKTPLHDYYISKIPFKFIEKYDSLASLNKLKVIDFGNLILNDSCYLPNGDHVSERGAVLTTNIFKYREQHK